jgi:hypothetical protein
MAVFRRSGEKPPVRARPYWRLDVYVIRTGTGDTASFPTWSQGDNLMRIQIVGLKNIRT